MTWFVFIAVLGIVPFGNSIASSLRDLQPPAVGVEPRLDARIGAPNPAQYRAVRNAREWRNPFLDVSNDGFRLRSISSPEPRFVALANLQRVLTELPLGDWPYGRVVVVQTPSIVPADDQWIAAMTRSMEAAKRILTVLDASWWAWPA
jgi:hypothetical protein